MSLPQGVPFGLAQVIVVEQVTGDLAGGASTRTIAGSATTASAVLATGRSDRPGSKSATAVRISPRLTRCARAKAAMLDPVRLARRTSSTTPSLAICGQRPDVARELIADAPRHRGLPQR